MFLDAAFELAISYLSSASDRVWNVPDEKLLYQKVHNQLASSSSRDADKFAEYYQKIKNSVSINKLYFIIVGSS